MPEDAEDKWAELAAQARTESSAWARSQPFPRLLLITICMQPQVSLLKVLMHQGSLQWDLQQWSRILSGQGAGIRLAEAAGGQVTLKVVQ